MILFVAAAHANSRRFKSLFRSPLIRFQRVITGPPILRNKFHHFYSSRGKPPVTSFQSEISFSISFITQLAIFLSELQKFLGIYLPDFSIFPISPSEFSNSLNHRSLLKREGEEIGDTEEYRTKCIVNEDATASSRGRNEIRGNLWNRGYNRGYNRDDACRNYFATELLHRRRRRIFLTRLSTDRGNI